MSEPREPFEVLGSRRVFDGKIASVRVDRVRMPQGSVVDREVVEHDRAVAVVAVDDDRRVVLVEQYRHPFRRRLWELPAGLMDVDGEDPLVTAQRELLEETGLTAGTWSVLVDIASSPGFTDEAVRIFLATDLTLTDRPDLGDDEESDLRIVRVPLADVVTAALAGSIVNSSAVAGVLAARIALADAVSLRPAGQSWSDGPAIVRGEGQSAYAPALPGVSARADQPGADAPTADAPVAG